MRLTQPRADRTMHGLSGRIVFLLLLVLCCHGLTTHAQTREDFHTYIDASSRWDMDALRSMKDKFSASSSPSERVFGLLISAKINYHEQELSTCMHKLDSLLHSPHDGPNGIAAMAHRLKCIMNTDLRFYPEAVKEADLGLALTDSVADPVLYAMLLVAKAEALAELPDYNQAHELLTQAYRFAEKADAARWRGAALLALGNIQYKQKSYSKALENYRQTIQIIQDPTDQVSIHAVSNLAAAAAMDHRYDLAMYMLDSLLEGLGSREPGLRAKCIATKGVISSRQKDYPQAIMYLRASLALTDSLGMEEDQAKTMQHLASTLWNTGAHQDALATGQKALDLAGRNHDVLLQTELHRRMGYWQEMQDDYRSAYNHLVRYNKLSDSLTVARFNQQLAHAEILFDTERKEHQIAKQQQALELAAAMDRRKNFQRLALALALAAILIIALLLWRSLRRKHKLAEQERQLHLQEVDDLMRRNEINIMQAMLDGQEKERSRTARDLHDRLGALLSTIKMQMSALEDKVEPLDDEQLEQFGKVTHLLDNAVGEVRRIVHDMNSVTLSRFGLIKALEDLCDNVSIHGRLRVELTHFGLERRMDATREIVIYRIVQELVSNAMKHAQPREISVEITRETGRFSMMVSDDGKGFDPTVASGGIGLDNIRHRAASIGATVRFDSTPGHGTTVSIEGPVLE